MRPVRRRAAVTLCASLLVVASGCDARSEDRLDDARLGILIDSLLPVISEASGLKVLEPVRFSVQSREQVRAFVERQLRDELSPAELDGMAGAYKMFGLLPDTLDLRALLLDLYTEQVIGYYDPESGRLYVVEDAGPATVGPVVAHELVHALQDQHTNLDSLVSRERGNDRQLAAQAAAEGHATVIMIALQAAEAAGQKVDPAALPDLRDLLRPSLEAENAHFPIFQESPRLIRETLIFPYVAGAGFVQALYRATAAGERPVPFGDRLPTSTEQVMDPENKFLDSRDAPTDLHLGEPEGGWTTTYSNTLGQLEVSILLAELLGDGARDAARGWDGDRYTLLRSPDGRAALAWYSVWDDDAAADRFAEAWQRTGSPDRATELRRLRHAERPLVLILLAASETVLLDIPVPPVRALEEPFPP